MIRLDYLKTETEQYKTLPHAVKKSIVKYSKRLLFILYIVCLVTR